jgi:hypothetical protein
VDRFPISQAEERARTMQKLSLRGQFMEDPDVCAGFREKGVTGGKAR